MRIGIDCRTFGASAGIGQYTTELVKKLLAIDRHNNYVLFFDAGQEVSGLPNNEKCQIKLIPGSRWRRYLPVVYSQLIAGWFISRQKPDICLFPANIIPVGYRGRAVVTVHDLAVYLMPELFPDRLIKLDQWLLVPRSLKRADRIIAVSENTKQDIIKLFKVAPEKIQVVYEGAEDNYELIIKNYELNKAKINDKYFLYLGTIEPRKNLVRLIGAFKKLKLTEPAAKGVKLILAGKNGWKNQEVFMALAQVNTELQEEAVDYLGYITAEKKTELLSHALAFVFLSLYEGFGLPVAESMAVGAPVVVAANSSLLEVGGQAVCYVDPLSEDQIFTALRKILIDEGFRQELIVKGKQKSQEFTWDKCARQTLEILNQIKQGD